MHVVVMLSFFVEIEVELVICCGMFYTRAVFYVMQTFVSLSVCPSCSSAICHFVSLSGSWPALKIGTVDRTSTMYVSFFFFFFFFFFLFFFWIHRILYIRQFCSLLL